MKWLLTAPKQLDLETVRREVEAAGGSLNTMDPIPLGDRDQVIYAEGPDDLHRRLDKSPAPIKADPDSELDLYG